MVTTPPAVLIVDDEPDARKVVRSVLEADGQIHYERTKVLMLTARDDAETRAAAEEAGADRYMTKPFSAVELLGTARALLATS